MSTWKHWPTEEKESLINHSHIHFSTAPTALLTCGSVHVYVLQMAVPEAEHVAHDGHHGRGPSEGHPRGEPSLNEVFPVISNEFATKWLTRHNFWEK